VRLREVRTGSNHTFDGDLNISLVGPDGTVIDLSSGNGGGDDNYGAGTLPSKHNLKTGGQIPAALIAEVDRKIDDGLPYGGSFQFSPYAPTGSTAPTAAACITGTAWNIIGEESNCAGASLF